MNSRDKGKRGEREAAKWWREHGFQNAARGQQHKGGPDSPDVVNVPGIHLEVKRRAKVANLAGWIAQARAEAPPEMLPVVMLRADDGEWMFVVGAGEFLVLHDQYVDESDRRLGVSRDG